MAKHLLARYGVSLRAGPGWHRFIVWQTMHSPVNFWKGISYSNFPWHRIPHGVTSYSANNAHTVVMSYNMASWVCMTVYVVRRCVRTTSLLSACDGTSRYAVLCRITI